MHKASEVQAAGASFVIMGAEQTMLKSKVPIIAVCAVRTGCGKSAATRRVCRILKDAGKESCSHPSSYALWRSGKTKEYSALKRMKTLPCMTAQ